MDKFNWIVGGETARQRLRKTARATIEVQDGADGTLADALDRSIELALLLN